MQRCRLSFFPCSEAGNCLSFCRIALFVWALLGLHRYAAAQVDADVEAQIDLDSLTDQELIDLYVVTYEETLRDSVVDPSSLVGPGRSLLQLGYSYSTQSDDGLRYTTHTVPELLVRHRLTPRIEVRAGWNGVTRDRLLDEPTGISDSDSIVLNPSLGLRFQFWQQSAIVPQTSVTVSTPVDVGTGSGFLARLNPQLALGYSWLVGDRWLVSGSSGAVWIRDRGFDGTADRFLDLQQSLACQWLINERASAYLQWLALLPEGARLSGARQSIGPGVSVPVLERTQVDVSTLFGLDQYSADFESQILVSWRF